MSIIKNRLLLGTSKGLLVFFKRGNKWDFEKDVFLGFPVSIATVDASS